VSDPDLFEAAVVNIEEPFDVSGREDVEHFDVEPFDEPLKALIGC
jgi:hypothetical protein